MTASFSQRRSTARHGARMAEAAIAEEKARQQQVADEEHAAGVARRAAARKAEAARVKYTAADLAGATAVRDEFGWHRVVQVNAKTVTVTTAYSWNDRIPLARVLEFRRAA